MRQSESTGSHAQLQSGVTSVELETMGFSVGKLGMRKTSFSGTSGTLNAAHFGGLDLGKNWQRRIMHAISM